jgi:hypothetical protein
MREEGDEDGISGSLGPMSGIKFTGEGASKGSVVVVVIGSTTTSGSLA